MFVSEILNYFNTKNCQGDLNNAYCIVYTCKLPPNSNNLPVVVDGGDRRRRASSLIPTA